MPSKDEILANADSIEQDIAVLSAAIDVMAKRGVSDHLRKQVQNRVDEWREQVAVMRRLASGGERP